MRCKQQQTFCILVVYVIVGLQILGQGEAHTKGRKVTPSPSVPVPVPVNGSDSEFIERQFMKWVDWVGTLRHSVFKVAQNKLLPTLYITVDKTPGVGDFNCVKQALDSLPLVNLVRVVIKVNPGVYTEKIDIPATKAFITVEGGGAENTVIQWGDTANTPGPRGIPIGTKNSATFAVDSPYFIAKNITFKASLSIWSRFLADVVYSLGMIGVMQNTAPIPPPGAVGKQAVAFRISGDTAAFWGCRFLGAQDTLYDDQGRHYFKECYIEGSVDFIFGDALSMYEGCHVHAIASGAGAVTAQKRGSLLEDTGFSFVKCKVTGSGALYLGRAWGTFSRVVYAYTYMDNIIVPKGWYNWGDPSRELTVFYGQYKCTGPGADFSGRVSWSRELTDEEAKPFIDLSYIDGDEWVKL